MLDREIADAIEKRFLELQNGAFSENLLNKTRVREYINSLGISRLSNDVDIMVLAMFETILSEVLIRSQRPDGMMSAQRMLMVFKQVPKDQTRELATKAIEEAEQEQETKSFVDQALEGFEEDVEEDETEAVR